jgi:hypothetical protein
MRSIRLPSPMTSYNEPLKLTAAGFRQVEALLASRSVVVCSRGRK